MNLVASNCSIIIPAYNEEESIKEVICDARKVFPDGEIIVVDDCSTDQTGNIAKNESAQVIRHEINRGYGASLKSGILAAKNDVIILLDADGQHKACDAERMLPFLSENDIVVGERQNTVYDVPSRVIGKFVLTRVVNFLARTRLKDINCGLRVMRKDVIKRYLPLLPDGFSFSVTSTLIFIKKGKRVKFFPVEVKKRKGKSKVNQIADGYTIFLSIIRLVSLFDPLRVFFPIAWFLVLTGSIYGVYQLFTVGRFIGLSTGSLLLIFTGVLSFLLGVICDQISALRLERYD
ncbi:MAG: glycosyltransferase family 2 protein [Candidatus Omnitrophica bacterium]|nr:glycosyltransferase family 2 protein [Candidatus Omnitrophota bacterium]